MFSVCLKQFFVMGKCRIPLDTYDLKPEGMTAYLRYNGWHFSKKMCEWAVRQMRKGGKPIEMIKKDRVDEMLQGQSLTLENDIGYDSVYVANMAKADFWNSSITGEAQLAQFIKDMIDDPDATEGFIFNRFYADCMFMNNPIDWDEMI